MKIIKKSILSRGVIKKMTRIKHFRDRCIGCAYCVGVAPEFWEMCTEDGRCDLIGSIWKRDCYELEIFNDEVQKNRKAADICPGKCFRVETN